MLKWPVESSDTAEPSTPSCTARKPEYVGYQCIELLGDSVAACTIMYVGSKF